MFHYVKAKNLPYSIEEVRRMIASCKICAEVKPRFHKPDMYREELTRDAFITGLASPAIRQHLLEKEELSLNQAFELADNLDRAHRYSSCMGPLVRGQSLSMMTPDSNAKNTRPAASTRRSSSPVVKAVSCFCGLDTHRNRSLCPARNASCHV